MLAEVVADAKLGDFFLKSDRCLFTENSLNAEILLRMTPAMTLMSDKCCRPAILLLGVGGGGGTDRLHFEHAFTRLHLFCLLICK